MPHVSSVHDAEPAEAIARTIGRRVREGRTGRGWTLDVLAQRSGVSRRMLVNVEQGVTNPSIATLLRSSPAGGSAVLVAGTEPPEVTELWDWRLGPADTYRSDAHRAGTRELLLVLSGSIELTLAGAAYLLGAGDSAAFEANAPHSYANPSTTEPARFTLAVHEPNVGKEPR